ncbi:hypothetical protein CXF68_09020 [Tenacibaculum sp. Bg11-29]|uniref:hypothetical protein n=1 Tax=Tenacibaculum sp. Bg11-29 TaxID=2058306 RepID=UPI000C340ABE|nr:hypothetical protein [Tenacibaculum sp. Bg11-29]PKH50819.1 hypothetical protein CXF68_09020 [Tenacibaculum sp. Bg11-29]
MKKLIGIGVIILTLFSCQYLNSLYSDNTLTEKIEAEFKSDSEIIYLTKLNSFEWNELLILGPYSIVESIEKELNLDLGNIRETEIEYSDSINLLVFLKDGKSVKISEVSRGIGDFTNLRQIIEKSKVIFVKTENGQNKLAE